MTDAEHVEIKLSDLSRIDLQPGDVLVYRHPKRIDRASAERIRAEIKKAFPGRRCCVIDEGAELAVLRPVDAQGGGSAPADAGPA